MIAEALFGDLGILLASLVKEIPHPQCALMFGDEVGNRSWKPMSPCQFQAFVHMCLQHSCTGQGVVQTSVGVFPADLILDEPVGGMELANVMVKRACSDQVNIGADRARAAEVINLQSAVVDFSISPANLSKHSLTRKRVVLANYTPRPRRSRHREGLVVSAERPQRRPHRRRREVLFDVA